MMTPYQQYIALSRYARFLPEEKRRESWEETVSRYCDYFFKVSNEFPKEEVFNSIKNLEIMPSMRCLMTAGKALDRDEIAGFNCSYLAIDDIRAFDEALYILMNGVGLGFSVERQFVAQLPEVAEHFFESDTIIKVRDSKIGWATSFRELLGMLYGGKIPKWDLSALRPAGAPLKTFGGRSSGPGPLNELFEFAVKLFKNAAGRKLNSLECHDLMCQVANIVVVGGVRRCLPSGSKVHTRLGMIDIEDIEVGDEVLTSSGYNKVSNKFDQGIQSLIRINTQDSYFDCTPNHQIAVLSGIDSYIWKQASELDIGDRVIAPSVPIEGDDVELPEFSYIKPKMSTTCTNITIPKLDSDIAWLFGLIQGDGYVSLTTKSGYIGIACTKELPNIITRARNQLERFGVNTTVLEYDNYVVVRCKSKQLATYFNAWLKQPKATLRVPEFIWLSKTDIKLSYISGLMDADGSVKTRPVMVCCTVYPEYAKEIQLLLSSCGVQSRLKKLSTTNLKDNWQEKYSVSLINVKSKQEIQKFTMKEINISSVEHCTNTFPKEFLEFSYPNNYPWSKTESKLIPVTVIGVDNLEEPEQTWDIEVEEAHEFFCNGYLMHNSALISLSNLSDDRMKHAKIGQWWIDQPQRALSNNSAAYTEKPSISQFMNEWINLYESKSGERGIINRVAAKKKIKSLNGRRKSDFDFGVNPCGEIILRSQETCNLSEIIIRENDTLDDLLKKVELATILGTFQSTLTNYRYLRSMWKKNNEEERLLGVSLTGIMDHPILSYVNDEAKDWLSKMREHAINTNKFWAEKLNINPSASITTVKPSGTVSQLVDSSSGIHPRMSKFYIRTVRNDKKDPLSDFLIKEGVPHESDVMKDSNWVFSFPMKSPNHCRIASDMTAIDQLEHYLMFNVYWTDHNPSITVYVRENEWLDVAAWVYKNFDYLNGVSFLPYSDSIYKQAPYQPITEQEYEQTIGHFPDVNFSRFNINEHEDNTTGVQTLACTGGVCEI